MKILEFPNTPPTPPLGKGGNYLLLPSLLRRGKGRLKNKTILALGAESAGNFSVFSASPLIKGAGGIFFSDNFGDLLEEKNWHNFQKAVWEFLRKNKLKPDIILTDLHPLYKTTVWGAELAKKYKAEHIQVQHHIAHIFSAIGEKLIIEDNFKFKISNLKFSNAVGIALDGTGYGLDGKIWGGEIFSLKAISYKLKAIRIGHLENQVMIGGDLAVKEPARMLIAILAKIPPLIKGVRGIYSSRVKESLKNKQDFVYKYVKKYYMRNQFELLYNQLKQNFNCQETSSTGRILDAVSLLLGFCGNERKYKHEPIDLLEQNSTSPYGNLKPKINSYYNKELRIMPARQRQALAGGNYELHTTFLFEYLIKNLRKNKKRLAATAQLYIAQGLYKIITKFQIPNSKLPIFLSGGISNNKIISNYLKSKGAYVHPVKLSRSEFNGVPRGDAGLSFGQIIYQLIK